MAQASEPRGFSRDVAAQLWASLFADAPTVDQSPLFAAATTADVSVAPEMVVSVSNEHPPPAFEPEQAAWAGELELEASDELADDWDADFEIDLLAEVGDLDWQPAPTISVRPRSSAPRQQFSIRQVLAALQPVFDAGETTWARLIGCVRMVEADPYSVARIATELADADVGVLAESPRQGRGRGGTLRLNEDGKYERIAHEAFAGLRLIPLTWVRVAAALGELRGRVAPSLRPRLLQYYAMHQLDCREEAALFAQLEQLRAAYPDLDPARDPEASDEAAETEGERLLRWRNLPAVAAIYHAVCEDNLWLVARFALALANRRMGFDDLFQDGCIGLLRAIDSFEPQRGFRFVTYAGNWVNQRIQRSIQNNDNVIRLPVHAREAYERGNDLYEDSEVVGRLPSRDELDAAADLRSATWAHLHNVRRVLPLHRSRAARLIVDDAPGPEQLVIGWVVRDVLDQLITEQGGARQGLLRQRLLLTDPPSLEAVAQRHGITRERVRQIADGFCRKVRRDLANRLNLVVMVGRYETLKVAKTAASPSATTNLEAAAALAESRSEAELWAKAEHGEIAYLKSTLDRLITGYPGSNRAIIRACLDLDCATTPQQVADQGYVSYQKVIWVMDAFLAYLRDLLYRRLEMPEYLTRQQLAFIINFTWLRMTKREKDVEGVVYRTRPQPTDITAGHATQSAKLKPVPLSLAELTDEQRAATQQWINKLIDASTVDEAERALLRVHYNFERPLSPKATAEFTGVGRDRIFEAHLKLCKHVYNRIRSTLNSEMKERKALRTMAVWMGETGIRHSRIPESSARLAQRVAELAATASSPNEEQPHA